MHISVCSISPIKCSNELVIVGNYNQRWKCPSPNYEFIGQHETKIKSIYFLNVPCLMLNPSVHVIPKKENVCVIF